VNDSVSDTLFVFAPAPGHTDPHHPEHSGRTEAIMQLLQQHDALAGLLRLQSQPATMEQVARVHRRELIERIQRASAIGGGFLGVDTYTTPESYEAAMLAAGSCCAAIDQLMSGQAGNGLAVVRPPGHHAESGRAGGFCLFNNVAVAARQAQAVHGAGRVAIVDFDVHHGNGTQEIFYEDESVLFISTHLYGAFFYPGTGAMEETGRGRGRGYTLNVPLPPRVGDAGFDQLFSDVVAPKIAAFRPDLILVSAGFDAHWADPLAYAGLSLTGYATLCRHLLDMAAAHCHGRILFVLEGGYLLDALAYGVLNLVDVLRGREQVRDPLGPLPHSEPPVTNILLRLRELHLLI
jgi:acetoin utilization deacetylase AcuC-like enzyme